MKNIKFALFGMLALGLIAFQGCKDACADITCLNGGTCVEGDCVCADGFEGTDCGTKSVTKFVGNYNTNEICSTGNYSYSSELQASASNDLRMIITNLYELGENVTAELDAGSTTSFTIPSVTIQGLTIQGTGSINTDGTTVTINYTVNDGSQTDNCVSTFTKQ